MSTEPRKVLFIGTVFPEPTSSAAGVRTLSLIRDLRSRGDTLLFASPSDRNSFSEALKSEGVETAQIKPNDPAFDILVKEFAPEMVIFDRFNLEEQFGWRVAEAAPSALRVLDTIDLHFLRRVRGEWLKESLEAQSVKGDGGAISDEALSRIFHSLDGIETEDCLRELASIYRSDLTLILSSFEMSLLRNRFDIPSERLLELGFSYPEPDRSTWLDAGSRKNFVSIGNFRHLPNRDSAFYLARVLWPKIREELDATGQGDAELHLYGAYPPKEIMALDNPKVGLRVLGKVDESIPTLRNYRALLAPIRFGAGIKGKIADAWAAGTPVVTTPMGAEGMRLSTGDFTGMVADTESEFIRDAVEIYSHAEIATLFREAGLAALEELYDPGVNREKFFESTESLLKELPNHRKKNIFSRILLADTQGRTKYFSKWIEEKNKRIESRS